MKISPGAHQPCTVYLHDRTCSPGFVDSACYNHYLLRLLNRLRPYRVQLHAYCLLPRRIYLLLTPVSQSALVRLLWSLNTSYSEYFHLRFQRSFRVWSDSPAITAVPTQTLLLDCQRFIERAAMVELHHTHPGEHEWTSYRLNAFTGSHWAVTANPALGRIKTATAPHARYRDFIARKLPAGYARFLKSCIHHGRPLTRSRASPAACTSGAASAGALVSHDNFRWPGRRRTGFCRHRHYRYG